MTEIRFSLIRHGMAYSNVTRVFADEQTCTGLTDHGHQQVGRLAERFRVENVDDPVTAIYSTPLRRARETAEPVAQALGLPVQFAPELRYPDYGAAVGRRWEDVYAAFDGLPSMHPHKPIADGAETWATYLEVMRAAVETLAKRHIGGHVLVVGSVENVVAASLIFHHLPAVARAWNKWEVDHTSVTTWDGQPASWSPSGRRWALLRHNNTEHLPPDERRRGPLLGRNELGS